MTHAGRVVARMLLGGLMLAPMPVAAQVPSSGQPRPASPAVFGGARPQEPGSSRLTVMFEGFGGYDTNVVAADSEAAGQPLLGLTGVTDSSYAGGSASVAWNRPGARVSSNGGFSTQYRGFFDVDNFNVGSYSGDVGLNARLTARSSVSLTATAGVTPFYSFGTLPGYSGLSGTPTTDNFRPDLLGARQLVLRYGGGANYSYQISERTTFSAQAGRDGFQPLNDQARGLGVSRLGATFAGARLNRRLTPSLGARLGYGYTQFDPVQPLALVVPDATPLLPDATTPTATPTPTSPTLQRQRFGLHTIDVGLDYAKALTFDRQTSLSFGTGTSIVRGANRGADFTGATRLELTGFATLQRRFLRTWGAQASYQRGTSYVEGFNTFGVFDSTSVSLRGLLTDRLDASAGAGYMSGSFRGLTADERIGSLAAGAQLRYAFSRNVASFVSYTYGWFDIPTAQLLPEQTVPFQTDRQGVRVGVTVWLDLLR